ncbi:tyrosine-type recombinase/integrase [Moraxella bovoculi]|nr:site-specific integrase [Moraxella bovoculi]AKG12226.1 integrase [Moraxella bovoculi]
MRLPKPRKRGDSYRIEIMLDGKRLSATRDTAKECTIWASQKILEHKAGLIQNDKSRVMSFAELIRLYHDKAGKDKGAKDTEVVMQRTFVRDFSWLASMPVNEITPKELTDWRNARLTKVSAGTVRREISYLSSVMSYAVKELFIITDNPFTNLTKPAVPKARNRRISENDVQAILSAGNYQLGQTPTQTQQYVVWAFIFAIQTAMRRGEILGVKKADIKDGYIHLPKTKNGDSRNVPLTPTAKEMLSWIKHDDERLLPITLNSFEKSWKRIYAKSGIDDLHFHDTRHEAISRFVKDLKLPVETLAKVTGHKDIKTLINTYYNPTIDELVDLFQKQD